MTIIVVLILFLILTFVIGIYFKNRVETPEDYYVAGRTLPWWVVMLTMSATYIGATATLAKSGLGYNQGYSSMMATFAAMSGMAILGLLSPKISRIGFKYRILSVSGLIRHRFGRTAGTISAVIVAWALIGTLAGQVVGAGSLLPVVFANVGLNLSYELAIFILVLVMIGYTLLSGMFGVAYTDVIQVTILIIGLAIALPILMLNEVGGWSAVTPMLPEGFLSFKPGMYVIGLMFSYCLYFMSGPPYWQRSFAAKTSGGSKYGIVLAAVLITIYSFMVTVVGMAARAIYPELPSNVQSADSVMIILVIERFHPVFAAIIVVSIMAAIMSTMDSYLLTAAQAMITDIYRVYKTDFTDKQELKLAKILVAVIALASFVFALYVRNILDALQLAMGFYSATLAAPLMAAVFWKNATKPACYASMFGGCAMYLIWNYALGKPWAMNPSIPGGIVSIVLMIVVSLATCKRFEAPYFEGVGKNDPIEAAAKQPEPAS
ncbi:MAG: sodium:solute symporter family protein [Clostridiales Family XIII bacterium]|jgi:SSS family solute:Na+ symporter|nr:sodium:solute symporter family protein [Clostridiales Family XIII bacterium]